MLIMRQILRGHRTDGKLGELELELVVSMIQWHSVQLPDKSGRKNYVYGRYSELVHGGYSCNGKPT